MIPSSLLPSLGAGAGAGAGGVLGGGGLGQLLAPLDYPRRAFTAPFAGGDPGLSMLPAAAGLLTGGGTLFTPLAPFAGLIGAGVAGGTQALFETLYPDRVKHLSTPEVTSSLGLDPDNVLANVAVGMATDPLTYAGALGGFGAGRAARTAVGQLDDLARAATVAESQAEQASALRQALQGPYDEYLAAANRPPKPEWLQQIDIDLAKGPTLNYRPDVIEAVDPVVEQALFGSGRRGLATQVYRQVDPRLAADMDALGMGVSVPGGTEALVTKPLPGFARSTGGWLKPTHARNAMLAGEDVGAALPQAIGPRIEGPLSVLDDPMLDFMAQRGASGFGPLGGTPSPSAGRVPSLGQVKPDLAQSLFGQNPGMTFPHPVSGRQAHLVDLPLDAALDAIPGPDPDVLARLAQTEPTLMQELVMRLGLAPRPPMF